MSDAIESPRPPRYAEAHAHYAAAVEQFQRAERCVDPERQAIEYARAGALAALASAASSVRLIAPVHV